MAKFTTNIANMTALFKSTSVLAGDVACEIINYDAHVKVNAVASASGVKLTMFADTDLVIDDKEVLLIGTSMNELDATFAEFDIEAGTKLALIYRETANVATSDLILSVEVTPN